MQREEREREQNHNHSRRIPTDDEKMRRKLRESHSQRKQISSNRGVNQEDFTKTDWKTLLMEDQDYVNTIEDVNTMIDEARKTEMDMRKMKQEVEFAKHLGLVKEYRKWSTEIYSPKTREMYQKSDGDKGTARKTMLNSYDQFLAAESMARRHGGYPYDRIYLDRWDKKQYDPWNVARASLAQTSTFPGHRDPLGVQEKHYLEEARGLHQLENGAKSGRPPLRAMKPWLQMPYSYYAWQNSGKWSKHWQGVEENPLGLPSVCASSSSFVAESTEEGNNE